MDLIADTSLLVGLWRKQDWAMGFAEAHPNQAIGLPWVVLGEFWHGALRAGHEPKTVEAFLQIGIPLCDPLPVIPVYAQLCARLQDAGEPYRHIAQNDLWIAAVALWANRPLITRNARHFDRIEGLKLRALLPG